MNLKDINIALDLIRNSNCGYTPLLVGPAGVGKTEGVKQWAKGRGYPVRVIQIGQMADAGDLIGLQYIESGKSHFTSPEWFPTEENTVLFFDEINRAPKDLQQAIFQLMSKDKEYNGRKLPSGCFVVAAMNPPNENYDVVDLGDDAWRDRFCYIKVEPTATEWIEYARANGVDERVVSFISAHKEQLGNLECGFNLSDVVKPTPRANSTVGQVLQYGESSEYPLHIVEEVIAGLIGPIPATNLFKFIKTNYQSIDAKKLLKNYSKVKEQVQIAAKATDGRFDMLTKVNSDIIAIAGKRKLTSDEFTELMHYCMDLPKDMAISFLRRLFNERNSIEATVEILKKGPHPFFNDGTDKMCAIAAHFGKLTAEDKKKVEEIKETA